MLRNIALCALLIGSTTAFAAEPQLLVKLDAKIVVKGAATAVNTRMVGNYGQIMSVQVDDAHPTKFELLVTMVAGKPQQYVAELQVTHDDRVCANPKVISTFGEIAAVQIGGGEDLIRIDLVVQRK